MRKENVGYDMAAPKSFWAVVLDKNNRIIACFGEEKENL
ncbi:MAG: hypothetical protein K0R19_802 [Bacillota bacterium]|jgi:hypothetical protein|nr:hypothetical protein [Bacillota bacterium]